MRRWDRRKVAVVGLWLATLAAIGVWAVVTGRSPGDAAADFVDAVGDSAWGPVAYVAAYLVRPLILFPATVLTVAGGFLFGAVAGSFLVLLASNASAMIAYGLGRWLRESPGGEAEDGAVPSGGTLARLAARARERGFQSVALMRLLFLPYDLVSYVSGALRVAPLPFLAATALASAPATIGFVLIGASLDSFDGGVPSLDPGVLLLGAGLIVSAIGLAEVLRRRERGRA